MAGELIVGYIPSQTGITVNVYTPAGVLRIADVACPESFSGSGLYIGNYAAITPGDLTKGFHNGTFLGDDVYEDKAALVTTIADPNPAGGTDVDAIFDMAAGSDEDDAYFNMIVTIVDNSGGEAATRRVAVYDGTNKRVTLDYPAGFPLAVGDKITIWANAYDSYSGPSVGQIADQVWDEKKSEHTDPGSMGLFHGIHGWHN